MIKKYPTNKNETNPALFTGIMCEFCGEKYFEVKKGGSTCCTWVELKCISCGEIEDWDFSTGEC